VRRLTLARVGFRVVLGNSALSLQGWQRRPLSRQLPAFFFAQYPRPRSGTRRALQIFANHTSDTPYCLATFRVGLILCSLGPRRLDLQTGTSRSRNNPSASLCRPRRMTGSGNNSLRPVDCCDKNVIVPCSERVKFDQNASECIPGKRLKNQVE